ncbi:MAG: hypothetical protein M3355_11895 [Actinomycetota bacterium]|nr:hypothetical protein [Actinomycetota bacterium]
MSGVPQPYRLSQPLDVEDVRSAYRDYLTWRQDARASLENAHRDLAEKERVYRKARAEKRVTVEAATAGERDDKVDSETADARYERDVAKGMVKVAEEKLEELDRGLSSVNRIAEWSMRLDPFAQEDRSRVRSAA